MLFAFAAKPLAQTTDADKLGMALDYFQAGKYHECLMLLEKLDAKYRLNPRFRAYLGVCYYYEWDYKNACKYLDAMIPELKNFAPGERSVYYWACAESHFNLQEYADALPLYTERLKLCHENERGDTYYRIGFCYMFLSYWQEAYDNFASALAYYRKFPNDETKSREAQTANMIAGIASRLPKPQPPADTTMAIKPKEKSPTAIAVEPLISTPDTVLSVGRISIKPVEMPLPKKAKKPSKNVGDINLDPIYKSGVEVK